MVVASPHPRQAERIEALRSYGILDSEREEDFDEIVKLASAICGTPISVINLIDVDRQWFKAETGLGVRETPLETSICSHVILGDDFVEIEDTQLDPRMAGNPLCFGDDGLRFYAGALLKTEKDLPLGTLCILDHQPRRLTPLQRDAIRVLANQVMARLDLRRTLKRAALLRQEVDHRVKNSLQSLSSLVRLASRRAKSDETISALSTINSRIEAVAKLHEELYRTNEGPIVDLGRYIDNLGRHFAAFAPEGVAVEIKTVPVSVTSAQAVAAGTLINEFVANSFKHAFPGGRTGIVRVTVRRSAGEGIVVLCEDNGVGLPEDTTIFSDGLGMQIAGVISAELQGELSVRPSTEGVSVELAFNSLAAGEE